MAETTDFNPFPQAAAEAPEAAPNIRWLTDRKRVESYALAWPFAIGDDEYREITIRRMTVAEVEAFLTRLQSDPNQNLRFPLYYDEAGEALPDAFWVHVDDDDKIELMRIGNDFLPARFQAAIVEPTASLSVQETGDIGGNSSAA